LIRNDRNGWFDQECAKITEEKNRKYRSVIQRCFTRAAREEYSEERRKERRTHKKNKKENYEKQLEWIRQCDVRKKCRKLY
jgi:hypothetical protein